MSEYTTFYLFLIHDGYLGCLYFGAIMENTAVNFIYKFLCGHMLLFLLDVFYILTCNAQGFQFLYIFTSIC